MAADIVLYKANYVPVGEDQLPHIELTNAIIKRFNQMFGKTFPKVNGIVTDIGARIMSLTDPTQKMSKSVPQGCIALSDSPKAIREKIKRAVTDSGKEIKYDEKNKPAISNLLAIYHLFSNKPIKKIEEQYKGKGYAEFKKDLAEIIIKGLKPIQEKRKMLEKNPQLVKKILTEGAKKAQKLAHQTMKEVKEKIGLV